MLLQILQTFAKPRDEIKYLIKTINGGEAGEYEKDSMKTKLNSDNNLSSNTILKFHMLTVIFMDVVKLYGL